MFLVCIKDKIGCNVHMYVYVKWLLGSGALFNGYYDGLVSFLWKIVFAIERLLSFFTYPVNEMGQRSVFYLLSSQE